MFTGIGIERNDYLPKAAQSRSTDTRRGNTGGALAQHVRQLAEQAVINDRQAALDYNAANGRPWNTGVTMAELKQAGWTGADCGEPELPIERRLM